MKPTTQTPVRRAYRGRIVTMDANDTVIPDGIVYIRDNQIVAVSRQGNIAPPEFDRVRVIATRGTIYPGLIELHNHLSYDALKLWQVPETYTNRDAWGRHPDYRRLISGPMNVLGKTAGFAEAIVRYVECKCLLGGVTTSQGIALFSNAGIVRFYRGLVRNAEVSNGPDMPAAEARIADVVAKDAAKFFEHLNKSSCLLLHLSEGTDARARSHFETLTMPDGQIAITKALVGIHCAALTRRDFGLMAARGASMVWSPLSNLLLYGATADVKAASEEGVSIGLGSDWSPSGSKNLLAELKIAKRYSEHAGGIFSDKQIVAMATRNGAKILKWDQAVGSIEANKRADLIVVRARTGDPYRHLIEASESDVVLVVIDGVPRSGMPGLMPTNGASTERWKVAGTDRLLNIADDADEMVAALTLAEAADRLKEGLRNLKALAIEAEKPKPPSAAFSADGRPRWFLQLDHEEPGNISIRPRLGNKGAAPEKIRDIVFAAAMPLSKLLGPLELDAITTADDADYVPRLKAERNLPQAMKEGM